MSKEVSRRLDRQLNQAESERSCLVAFADVDRRALERRVRAGSLVRPLPLLYVRAQAWEELEPDEQALWVVRGSAGLHPDWTFCGVSAALAHGLQVAWRSLGKVHIATAAGSQTFDELTISRHYVSGDETCSLDGVRATSLWRTVFDCARWLPRGEALAVADSALKKTGRDAEWLVEYFRVNFKGYRGLRRSLEVAEIADARSDNAGESLARSAIIDLGFECPDLQYEVADPLEPHRSYFVDFAWLDEAGNPVLFGELDGYRKTANARYRSGRTPERVLADERRRESRISRLGVPVVRFSLAEATNPYVLGRLLESFGAPFAA